MEKSKHTPCMFDSIAQDREASRPRRGAAMLLSTLSLASAVGLGLLLGPTVAPPELESLPVMVWPGELALPAPGGGGGVPAPKPSAKPRARPATPAPAISPQPPTPDSLIVLDPAPAPEAAVPAEDGPTTDGQPPGGGGQGPGKGPGTGTGPGTGNGPGGEGGGQKIRDVTGDVAVPRVRAVPRWPAAATSAGIREGLCVTEVVIDEAGAPADIHFRDCPVVFQAEARAAAAKWRWNPVIEDEHPIRARFLLNFRFVR